MNQKLAELILFISEQLVDDRYPGFKVKLHKILCRADFAAYRARGRSITGENYVNYDNGPFLKAIEPTVAKLRMTGVAQWAPEDQYGAIRLDAFRPSRAPEICEEEELAWVRDAITWARDRRSQDVVLESHRWFGWITTRNNEVMPYDTAVVGDFRALDQDENTWALDLIARYRDFKRARQEYCP